ncbi:MAG: hypothetical protein JOZ54_15055 [Acidobacteria bacterium]|nr:hypothetical protein [Acidobacteriota bacterium]
MPPRRRFLILAALALVVTALVFAFVPRIPQDQGYHHFADTRPLAGIPNAANVLSNLGFLVAGIFGLMSIRSPRAASFVLFGGVVATAFGSGAYHWFTNDAWLVWDRVGIMIAFAGFFALVIEDRIGWPDSAWFPILLAIVNIMTIALWRVSGDLRAYGIAQFFPLLATIVLCAFFRARHTHGWMVWLVLACYVAAKFCEDGDAPIDRALHFVSGHTLKHLLGALGAFLIALWLRRRQLATSLRSSAR